MNKFSKIIISILTLIVIGLIFVILNPFTKNSTTTTNNNSVTTQTTKLETTTATTQTTNNTSLVSSVVPTTPSISQEEAINTALGHAGFNRNTVRISSANLENFDDTINVLHYDIDFVDNMGYEYEYKIDATSGQILRNKKEFD